MKNLILILFFIQAFGLYSQNDIPHLEQIGNRHQLIVNGEPYLMIAGELGNSTATSMESMSLVWERMQKLNVNTILIPIYWELIEPEEGVFDFSLLDQLVEEARKQDMKFVPLWFGSWKNSMSSHAPSWVKLNQERFPRAKSESGISQEILSPFYPANMEADKKAYVALLEHIKEIDQGYQTIILMQPENEIGMLPSARDHSKAANKAFNQNVPSDLINYLIENKETLNPEFKSIWAANGYKTKGNWEEIFGEGIHTEEIFMAYYFAQYANTINEAGKRAYNLPSYVNAALNHHKPSRLPGQYPSAGPLPHLLDVWRAGSPSIDFYSPDFYNPDFKHWCDLYVRQGNPLFVPEHRFDKTVAAKALYAFGHYESLGFSPFSIQQIPSEEFVDKEVKLSKVYAAIHQIKPLLDKYRGQNRVDAVLLHSDSKSDTFYLGDYEITASHTFNLGWEAQSKSEDWNKAAALIIQSGPNEFYYVGFGVSLTFKNSKNPNTNVGILKAERGYFDNNEWIVFQHLNGDQTHQGRHIRSFIEDVCIQRFTLYEYD